MAAQIKPLGDRSPPQRRRSLSSFLFAEGQAKTYQLFHKTLEDNHYFKNKPFETTEV